jgi:hypothetical protein
MGKRVELWSIPRRLNHFPNGVPHTGKRHITRECRVIGVRFLPRIAGSKDLLLSWRMSKLYIHS